MIQKLKKSFLKGTKEAKAKADKEKAKEKLEEEKKAGEVDKDGPLKGKLVRVVAEDSHHCGRTIEVKRSCWWKDQ